MSENWKIQQRIRLSGYTNTYHLYVGNLSSETLINTTNLSSGLDTYRLLFNSTDLIGYNDDSGAKEKLGYN